MRRKNPTMIWKTYLQQTRRTQNRNFLIVRLFSIPTLITRKAFEDMLFDRFAKITFRSSRRSHHHALKRKKNLSIEIIYVSNIDNIFILLK